jgi:hypothetical protein
LVTFNASQRSVARSADPTRTTTEYVKAELLTDELLTVKILQTNYSFGQIKSNCSAFSGTMIYSAKENHKKLFFFAKSLEDYFSVEL